MGNTFSCLNVHCVFSTKEQVPIFNPEIRERLWPYLGGIAKENGIQPKKNISGTSEADQPSLRDGSTFILFPGTSCQAVFADYGAPDSQGFAQPPSAVAT